MANPKEFGCGKNKTGWLKVEFNLNLESVIRQLWLDLTRRWVHNENLCYANKKGVQRYELRKGARRPDISSYTSQTG